MSLPIVRLGYSGFSLRWSDKRLVVTTSTMNMIDTLMRKLRTDGQRNWSRDSIELKK